MRIGIAITRAASTVATHSTVHVIAAALSAGHQVRVLEPWDFEVDERGKLIGRAHVFDAPASREDVTYALVRRTTHRRTIELERLDVLLLRINPLSDAVLTFAQMARDAGVRVLNDPAALIRTSHKAWLASLSGVPRPRTVVTRSFATLEVFASGCGTGVVVKPARSSGGRGVGVVFGRSRGQLEAAFRTAGAAGDGYVVVQEYLPEALQGEKRLLWLDGQLLGGYLRKAAPGEFRHNLKAGATPLPVNLTQADHALLQALTPHLQRSGVWFAGVDVIGGRVVEVNTLNPGGLHYSSLFSGKPFAEAVVERLSQAQTTNPKVTNDVEAEDNRSLGQRPGGLPLRSPADAQASAGDGAEEGAHGRRRSTRTGSFRVEL